MNDGTEEGCEKVVVVVVALGGRCGAAVVDACSGSWLRGVAVNTLESEPNDEVGVAGLVGEGGSGRVGALSLTRPLCRVTSFARAPRRLAYAASR